MMKRPEFKTETELCAAFIGLLPKEWVAYPETGGFDILLVGGDGTQIGIEAKLTLNPKVLNQALSGLVCRPESGWQEMFPAPDHRAILVPIGAGSPELADIAAALGVTVIVVYHEQSTGFGPAGQVIKPGLAFRPWLPSHRNSWHDFCPAKRIALPPYVPDVAAGASAPVALTTWKIGAIKLAIILARRGFITRADFHHVSIDSSRWVRPPHPWLDPGVKRGEWVASKRTPDLAGQHKRNYAEIEADFAKWGPKDLLEGTNG